MSSQLVSDPAQLRTVFDEDPVRAILLARQHWKSLPSSFQQDAAMAQNQAAVAQQAIQTQNEVNSRLSMYGIAPRYNSGAFYGPNPQHLMFMSYMAEIQKHRGDPPTAPAFTAIAYDVVVGELSTDDALQYLMTSGGLQEQQAAQALQAMGALHSMRAMNPVARGLGQFAKMLGLPGFDMPAMSITEMLALTGAALAVPRSRIAEALRNLPPR